MLYTFQLLVQHLAVAGYLAQVAFNAYEFLSRACFCVLDYSFRHAHLPCQFECERVAGESHFKLEHRCDVLYVEHHCSVDDAGFGRCVKLEVCIVGGYDAVCASFIKLAEYGFSDGSSGGRFCS